MTEVSDAEVLARLPEQKIVLVGDDRIQAFQERLAARPDPPPPRPEARPPTQLVKAPPGVELQPGMEVLITWPLGQSAIAFYPKPFEVTEVKSRGRVTLKMKKYPQIEK